jgi:hypothetical protein
MQLDTTGVSVPSRNISFSPETTDRERGVFDSTYRLSVSSKSELLHVRPLRPRTEGTPIPTALVTPLPGSSPPHEVGCGHQTFSSGIVEHADMRKGGDSKSVIQKVVYDSSLSDTDLLIGKWQSLIDMKDRLLKQKNIQIERQKAVIMKLQQDTCELEAKLHHQMVVQVGECGGSALEARLQVRYSLLPANHQSMFVSPCAGGPITAPCT